MTDINARAQSILSTLVSRYIKDGQPVGSKVLVKDSPVKLSAATIRNVMSELEAAGYLQSPHTSAGRIPTKRGYRYFVDSLLAVENIDESNVSALRQHLDIEGDKHTLVQRASNLVSGLTELAGIVTIPKQVAIKLRHIELLPLAGNRVLVVLVVNHQDVRNQIIETNRIYSPSELQQVSNYLTQHFAGMDLADMHHQLLMQLRNDKQSMQDMMQSVVDVAEKTVNDFSSEDYVLTGENNLLSMANVAGVDKLKQLFEAFNQKRDMLGILEQCLHSEELKIFIGDEAGYNVLDDCSLVTAPYKVQGKSVGVLGVIGPTRMAYEKVISAVNMTAKLLGSALSDDADLK